MYMTKKSETKILHFTVDPQGVVDLARQVYWFEGKKAHGVDILRCFIGIESYQITRILEGDATVKEQEGTGKKYYEECSDEYFKSALADFLACQKRRENNPDLIKIGNVFVCKDLIDEYAGYVVKRLRDSMRNTRNGIMFEFKEMEEILGLENQRQEMHDAILHAAGFDRDDDSDEAYAFKNALDSYVDKLAGTLFDEPVTEMSSEEIVLKRKQSDDIVSYMDKMNLMEAKKRGII